MNKRTAGIRLFVLLLIIGFFSNSYASCEKEIHKYCSEAYREDGDVLKCLSHNYSELSAACKKHAESIELARQDMLRNCSKELDKFCYRSSSKDIKPFPACLIENKRGAYQDCRKTIKVYEWSLKSSVSMIKNSKSHPTLFNDREFRANGNPCLSILSVLPVLQHEEMKKYLSEQIKAGSVDNRQLISKIEELSREGVADASFTMGVVLQSDRCVVRDKQMSLRYYKKAADQGNERAKNVLENLSNK